MLIAELHTPKGKRFLFGVLALLSAFPALSTDLYMPGFLNIAREFHTNLDQVQLTLAFNFFGLGIGQLIWGPISDRYGRRKPAIVGIGIYAAASLACALSNSLSLLILARTVQGLCAASAVVVGRAIVRDLFEGQEMARALATVSSIYLISPMLGPLLGAAILNFSSWHFEFIVLTAVGIIAIFCVAKLPETLSEGARVTTGLGAAMKDYGFILKDREFRFGALQATISSFMIFIFVGFLPAVLMEHFGLNAMGYAIVFGSNAFFMIVSTRINHRLLRNHKVATVLRYAVIVQLVVSTLLFALGNLTGNFWVVTVLMIASIFSCATISGNSTTLALHNFKSKAAQAGALVGVSQNSISSVFMSLVSLLPIVALTKSLLFMWLVGLTGFVVLVLRERSQRKHAVDQS